MRRRPCRAPAPKHEQRPDRVECLTFGNQVPAIDRARRRYRPPHLIPRVVHRDPDRLLAVRPQQRRHPVQRKQHRVEDLPRPSLRSAVVRHRDRPARNLIPHETGIVVNELSSLRFIALALGVHELEAIRDHRAGRDVRGSRIRPPQQLAVNRTAPLHRLEVVVPRPRVTPDPKTNRHRLDVLVARRRQPDPNPLGKLAREARRAHRHRPARVRPRYAGHTERAHNRRRDRHEDKPPPHDCSRRHTRIRPIPNRLIPLHHTQYNDARPERLRTPPPALRRPSRKRPPHLLTCHSRTRVRHSSENRPRTTCRRGNPCGCPFHDANPFSFPYVAFT